ncbi:MAG: Cof-type HAD-IIB family hydrolase [Bacteroides sp.]
MDYKLLVLDVDGTLLTDEGQISKRTLAALKKAQQMGVILVLASGRPLYGLKPLAKKLDLDKYGGYLLAYNGAQIVDMSTGQDILSQTIEKEVFPFLEKEANKHAVAIFTYSDEKVLTNDASNPYILREARINGMEVEEHKPLAPHIDFNPHKSILVNADTQEIVELEEEFKKRLDGVMNVFRTEPYFLEVVPELIDKANALGVLFETLKLDAKQTIVIGNGVADYAMIQLAGLGVAMGNAIDSVKRCADLVTASNNEDGVALVVEEHILAGVTVNDIDLDSLTKLGEHALMGNLGIQYTYAAEGRIEATMPVDERTRQPFGILHGGATLALAETIAGLGSMVIVEPDEFVVGMQVSGNHISSAHEGDTVRAVATLIHRGRSSHIWNVDVFTSTDKLVSSIRVMNSVLKRR